MNTTPATVNASKVLTVKQLAALLDVTTQTIYKRLDAGSFPNAYPVGEGGGRLTLIPVADVVDIAREEAAYHETRVADLNDFLNEHGSE